MYKYIYIYRVNPGLTLRTGLPVGLTLRIQNMEG